ncbi:unnamed protein product, partial [Prorocentrum cordatum]
PTDGGGDGKQAHQEQCSCVFAPLARRHPHRPNFGRARRWRAECCGDDRRAARRCSGGADHPAVAAASIDRLDSRTPSPPPMRWRRHGDSCPMYTPGSPRSTSRSRRQEGESRKMRPGGSADSGLQVAARSPRCLGVRRQVRRPREPPSTPCRA